MSSFIRVAEVYLKDETTRVQSGSHTSTDGETSNHDTNSELLLIRTSWAAF